MFGHPLTYLAAAPAYVGWLAVCLVLLSIFAVLYCLVTPKNELQMIRDGNTSAAVSLVGALIGFAIMMAAVMMNATNRADLIAWTLFGLLVQLLAYFAAAVLLCGFSGVRAKMNQRFARDDMASAVFVGGLSIAVGIVSAAVMAS